MQKGIPMLITCDSKMKMGKYFNIHFQSASKNHIQTWHLGECNINFYSNLKNDIARGACAESNIIFQSAIEIDIARNQSAIFVFYMPTAHSSRIIY